MLNELLSPIFMSINQLFNFRFSIPIYQRPYLWQKKEVDSLLLDIWESYEQYREMSDDDKQKASIYFGNIILHKKSVNLYDIIDGQQRITTFAICLLTIYAKSFELKVDKNDRRLIKIQSALWKTNANEEVVQDQRLIELGSIDKQILVDIFDEAFSQPHKLKQYVDSYTIKSPFDQNVINNFNYIYGFLNTRFNSSENELDELLQFANFMLGKVHIIAVINENHEVNAFSIFESINSKGKKLEDIDLIKTRIFSLLSQSDYSSYLNKWGKLIIDTEDRLYEFFKVYIKANIKYISGNVTYKHFEKMDDELCNHFKVKSLSEAYKTLIEDMISRIECYNAVNSLDTALKIVSSNKFKFYYSVYSVLKYEHPWALFFRCFCEYCDGKLSKEDLISVIIETIKFSVTFSTICGRESKEAISMFSEIFSNIYTADQVNKDGVIYHIKNKISSLGIRKEDIVFSLESADVYTKNKQLGVAVLSVWECKYGDSGGDKISWDEAYSKISSYGSSYTLDHIMPQNPNSDDPHLKYYKLGNNLKLKEGHDFPLEKIHDGMEYELFKSRILHRVGNLRLQGRDGNLSKGNLSSQDFCTNTQLNERNETICKFFVDNVLNISPLSNNFKPENFNEKGRNKKMGNFDFSMYDLDFAKTKPQSITFRGDTTKISTNREIIENIVKHLFIVDKNKMVALASQEWRPIRRIILASDKTKLIRPFEIISGQVYLEINLSAKDVWVYSARLLEEFNVDKTSVSVFLGQ